MTPPKLVFYLTCLSLAQMGRMHDFKRSTTVNQENGFISAQVGDNLTLRCVFEGSASKYHWYKQTVGQKPMPVSVTYKLDKHGTFRGEFKDNPRFTLETEVGMNHLKISDVQLSDSATYYCASSYSFMFEFGEGTFVSVEGSGLNIPALLHQSVSESIQPGGSVTLNCTVHTGTCDGEHSVYWFKTFEESHPGLIFTHGGSRDQCERKPNTQTQTCVYNLPMKSVNYSHAGTYYCAVVSCGHILFGKRTDLVFEDNEDSLVLVYFLSGALVLTTVLVILLAFSAYRLNKRHGSQSTDSQAISSGASATNAEGLQDADALNYAALRISTVNRSTRQRVDTRNECLYSTVRQ